MTTRVVDGRALLVSRLEALLGVEARLERLLPALAGETDDVQLRRGFERHAHETAQHVLNLQTALRVLGEEPVGREPACLEALERDHAATLASVWADAPPELRDLVGTSTGSQLEHLEIALYEGALQDAELLGEEDVAELLHANLEEERAMLDEGKAVAHRLASTLVQERLRTA